MALQRRATAVIVSCGLAFGGGCSVINGTMDDPNAEADPPVAILTDAPAERTKRTQATFAFTCEDASPPCRFECAVDELAFEACTSPHLITGLDGGEHRFRVLATDARDNAAERPVEHRWVVDTTDPLARLTASPDGPTRLDPVIFEFTCDDESQPCTFVCGVDDDRVVACMSPHDRLAVGNGEHTFYVRATDAVGNQGVAVSQVFVVDRIAPRTTITSTNTLPTNEEPVSVHFTCDDPDGCTFGCALDGAAAAPCTTPWRGSNLPDRVYRLTVTATDAAGNTEDPGATHSFVVDHTVPTATLTPMIGDLTNATEATFEFTCNEPECNFTCEVNGVGLSGCESPHTVDRLVERSYEFRAVATDAAGNEDPDPDSHEWIVDLTAPQVAFTSTPAAAIAADNVSIAFVCADANGCAQTECDWDGAGFQLCTSPRSTATPDEIARVFSVRATDNAGNVSSVFATRFVVDNTPPQTRFVQTPDVPTNAEPVVFRVGCTDVHPCTFECNVDNAAPAQCLSLHSIGGLADGDYTFVVVATDAAANKDATEEAFVFTVDRTAPDTVLTSTPTAYTSDDPVRIEFNHRDRHSSTFECALDRGAFAPCTSPWQASVNEGSRSFAVRATDAAGNVDPTPATYAFFADRTAPVPTITAGPAADSANREATFEFECSDDSPCNLSCSLDGDSPRQCASPLTYRDLGAGWHTIEVHATDAAGNQASPPARRSWRVRGTWRQVSAGRFHTCAVDTAGRRWCWGANGNWYLGDGTQLAALTPRRADSSSNWDQVTGGIHHGCGVRTDATAWCWGLDLYGRLGTGRNAPSPAPVVTPAGVIWRHLAAGFHHTCGVTSADALYCWGRSDRGQLGLGAVAGMTTPARVGGAATWHSVVTGYQHTCAINSEGNGELWCWGENSQGQVGDGTQSMRDTPQQITSAAGWRVVAAGDEFTCGIEQGGALRCWGSNGYGKNGTGADRASPTRVGTASWTALGLGRYHACGVQTDGTLWCWGRNDLGALGDDTGQDRAFPGQVGTSTTWRAVTAGDSFTCGTTTDHAVLCWGSSSMGELGHPPEGDSNTPQQIGIDTRWTSVSASGHTCATKSDGTVWCWGLDNSGQLGLPSSAADVRTPRQVTSSTTAWRMVGAGFAHTCATQLDGALWCWGLGERLGLGGANALAPTRVGVAAGWRDVAGGSLHTCATRDDGTAWCWGSASHGQTGLGSSATVSTPMQVGAAADWAQLDTGAQHTCAVKSGGQLWCWGANQYTQLGLQGPNLDVPTAVDTDTDWDRVSAGNQATCATKTDGRLLCWGQNSYGELGDGSTDNAHADPTPVAGSAQWDRVDSRSWHTCGRRTDGTLWCWGANNRGQLGDGTRTNSAVPVQAGADADWARLSVGFRHTCAIKLDGTLWCWGTSARGEAGTAGQTWRSDALEVVAAP